MSRRPAIGNNCQPNLVWIDWEGNDIEATTTTDNVRQDYRTAVVMLFQRKIKSMQGVKLMAPGNVEICSFKMNPRLYRP